MRPLQRIDLIGDISKSLKERYDWDKIHLYLHTYNNDVQYPNNCDIDEYMTWNLAKFDDSMLITIAEELGQKINFEAVEKIDAKFWKLGYYKLFISHLTTDKISACNLKVALTSWGIDSFVAHEDIRPSKLWQSEIEKALFTMNCLCAIVVPKFYLSKWCDQEVGVAIGRKTPIISIKKGANPHGFISKYQAIAAKNDAIKVAEDLVFALCEIPEAKEEYIKTVKALLLNSKNTTEAIQWISVINKLPDLEKKHISDIHSAFTDNENFNDKVVLKQANELFKKYSLNAIEAKAFNKNILEDDDLPF